MKPPKLISYKELKEDFPGFGSFGQLRFECPPTYGQMSYQEQAILNEITFSIKPKNILEIGRCDGLSASNFSLAAPQSVITTVDLPEPLTEIYETSNSQKAHERWGRDEAKNIYEVLIDSKNFKTSLKYQLILIDGDHSKEGLEKDIENCLTFADEGCIIVVHDYGKRSFPGVTAVLADLAETREVKWINSRADFLETSLCYFKV